MPRRYNSSRRKKAAAQTRKDILRAALKLHWEGVTEFEPLAREAGCSLATVRKHFPTKEALYRDCTRTFGATLTMPNLEVLANIQNQLERLQQCLSALCRIHEAMLGYAWLCAHQRQDSPVLDAVMSSYAGLADAITSIVTPAGSGKAPVVRGFLDFLTYRALRLSGNLAPQQIPTELFAIISTLLGASNRSTVS